MDNLFFQKYAKPVLFLFVLSFPLVYWGSRAAFETNTNRFRDWLPDRFEETEQLVWFIEQFGGDDLLVVSWDGYTVGDPRAAELAARLRKPHAIEGKGDLKLFREVVTAAEARNDLAKVLSQVSQKSLKWSERRALSELEGWIVGPQKPDGTRTASLLVLFTLDGFDHRHEAVKLIRDLAREVVGVDDDSLHIAGPTMDSVAIDEASASSLNRLTMASAVICLAIAYYCFRSILVTLFVLTIAVFNQQLSLSLLYITGATMDSIQLMVPSLVFVLSVSAAVHLVNYYRDAIVEMGLEKAPFGSLQLGWVPCFLAAATTSIGLVSLLVSFLVPIQKFGGYAALGVMCGTGVMFLVLPSLLTVFPPRRWSAQLGGGLEQTVFHINWQPVLNLVTRHRFVITACACAALAVSLLGVRRIEATARVHDMFSRDAKILQDYRWLENEVGPLIPIEIVVRLPKPAEAGPDEFAVPMLDRFLAIQQVQEAVGRVEGVESVMSVAKFAPLGEQDPNRVAKKAVWNRALTNHRNDLIRAGLLRENSGADLWRISARVNAGDRHDYSAMIERIRSAVEPKLQEAKGRYRFSEASAVYTGSIPIVMKAQEQLLKDLLNSFVAAFACIAVAMVVLLRSFAAGLMSMIPNALPAVAVFGIMGLIGVKVEVGSMMTATAAMGIAVDDTLHFLTWYQRGLREGKSRREAVRFAYQWCGKAMVQTSLICGLGLVVFAFSPFGPISRFGMLMCSMLFAAIIGDLIVLPALLISPLGRAFRVSTTSSKITEAVPEGAAQ